MNATLGTSYLRICLSTVIDWLCTPPTEQRTSTAPSSTRSARSTSTVKSTCPGVSIMLICVSFQEQKVAADAIVMPRSFSSSMLSITAPGEKRYVDDAT